MTEQIPKALYDDGEKVLCFHGPLLYEAKCLRSQLKEKSMKYFIHYSGWNKNWDEWVPECRVLKYNEINLQKQKELSRMHLGCKKSKSFKFPIKSKEGQKEGEKEGVKSKEGEKEVKSKEGEDEEESEDETISQLSPTEKPRSKPEKRPASSPEPELSSSSESLSEDESETTESLFEEETQPEPEIRIKIPPLLRDWLIDDHDFIFRQKKIQRLPARITVEHIIASYVQEKVSGQGLTQNMENSLVEFANYMRECFNVTLGKNLLYKFERPAYADMLQEYPGTGMCEIYGAIHLLRMFTKMGEWCATYGIDSRAFSPTMQNIQDLIQFMARNPNYFSVDDYIVASPEYHRRAL